MLLRQNFLGTICPPQLKILGRSINWRTQSPFQTHTPEGEATKRTVEVVEVIEVMVEGSLFYTTAQTTTPTNTGGEETHVAQARVFPGGGGRCKHGYD